MNNYLDIVHALRPTSGPRSGPTRAQRLADAQRTVNADMTSFFQAIKTNNVEEVTRVLSRLKLVDDTQHIQLDGNCLFLTHAIRSENMEIVRETFRVMSENVNAVNNGGQSSLMLASSLGNVEIVKFLLREGTRVDLYDKNGCTVLNYAVDKGHAEIVKLLLSKTETDVNAPADSPNAANPVLGINGLMRAAREGRVDLMEMLLRHPKRNIEARDHDGNTALHHAAQGGSAEAVRLLLNAGAAIDARNSLDMTGLIIASEYDYSDAMQVLVESGADVNAMDKEWRSPLFSATEYGNLAEVERLTAFGANVNAMRKDKSTPLMVAATDGSVEVGKLLIVKGANVNATNDTMKTAALYAMEGGHTGFVKLLVENGAYVVVPDFEGKTCLELALESKNVDLVRLMIKNDLVAGWESHLGGALTDEFLKIRGSR